MDYGRTAVCVDEANKQLMKDLRKYDILENVYKDAEGKEKEAYSLLKEALKEKINILILSYQAHLESLSTYFA